MRTKREYGEGGQVVSETLYNEEELPVRETAYHEDLSINYICEYEYNGGVNTFCKYYNADGSLDTVRDLTKNGVIKETRYYLDGAVREYSEYDSNWRRTKRVRYKPDGSEM